MARVTGFYDGAVHNEIIIQRRPSTRSTREELHRRRPSARSNGDELQQRRPSTASSVFPAPCLATKLMALAEEQLAMEQRLKKAGVVAKSMREKHLDTVTRMAGRFFLDNCGALMVHECFRQWAADTLQSRAKQSIEKEKRESRVKAETFERDFAALHETCQKLEEEKNEMANRIASLESNFLVVRQEAIGYAEKADRLAHQLMEAEKCILKLQSESQHVLTQVRHDVANYCEEASQRGEARTVSIHGPRDHERDVGGPHEHDTSAKDVICELKNIVANVEHKVDELRASQTLASQTPPVSAVFGAHMPRAISPTMIQPVHMVPVHASPVRTPVTRATMPVLRFPVAKPANA